MKAWRAYLIGLATIPAAGLLWVVAYAIDQFREDP